MLELKEIVKEYYTQDETVRALKGVSVKFRESEFVSILGPSGCGKTTLLNIVGGLDRYTSGDLIINGKSTTSFTDKDWDTYRNHSIGFVFQSYNLIPHQTVLENVELALTLSGVKAAERRERAIAVLEKVGLGSKINARPNQLSGGQMQRVAIARALINNPDILLADEPTGALDSKTSVQIMDLLKEISSEMLIIMVTHNPELAEKYSSRIIKLLDGELVGDDNPVSDEEAAEIVRADEEKAAKLAAVSEDEADTSDQVVIERVKGKKKRTSMSFLTALSLSFKNLLTKKTRTLLVSFAGSIGIIGIAIILSLSSGFQNYINGVQRDTLSNYPVQIMRQYTSFSVLMTGGGETERDKSQKYPSGSELKVNDTIGELYREFMKGTQPNDIQSFKRYLDNVGYDKTKITAIQYSYSVDFDVYGKPYGGADGETKFIKNAIKDMIKKWSEGSGYGTQVGGMDASDVYFPVWSEMIDNVDVIKSQYELVGGGRWISPEDTDKIMVVANAYNEIPSYVLASIGLAPEPALSEQMPEITYKADDLAGKEFYLLTKPMTYVKESEKKYVKETDESRLEELAKTKGRKVSIAGVIRPKEGVAATSISGYLVYSSGLTKALIEDMNNTELVKEQRKELEEDGGKVNLVAGGTVSFTQKSVYDVLGSVGLVNPENPSAINIYPATFEDKDYVNSLIETYNNQFPEEGDGSEKRIKYDDYLGMALSSMTTIINAVSYVLIGFVSVSLIVSSIMIGIITYISVLERIKEIGVLRALGASKRDVSRVFNAETLIIGFAAGIIGIGITVLLDIPISLIIKSLAGISNVAVLPWQGGLILVAISMVLTLIAGLIPSKIAAKKDPVIALRSE